MYLTIFLAMVFSSSLAIASVKETNSVQDRGYFQNMQLTQAQDDDEDVSEDEKKDRSEEVLDD
ncbi:MAG: hypothetical protein KBB83_00320 [Alphaproteobacteria bacterium]|nr:hypothetical protein [Alphaproteobacteria bacterium]